MLTLVFLSQKLFINVFYIHDIRVMQKIIKIKTFLFFIFEVMLNIFSLFHLIASLEVFIEL